MEKDYCGTAMTSGFLKVLTSDVVKDAEWIYESKNGEKSVCCSQRAPCPPEAKSIDITTSKESYRRLFLTVFQTFWISVME